MQLTSKQIMQATHEQITLVGCAHKQWDHFKDFHYQQLELKPSAICHVAILEVEGVKVVIGFCAHMPLRGAFAPRDDQGRRQNAYIAHKTVVRMPESPAMFHLWALVSDAQALHCVKQGVLFYSRAPIVYAAYRDNPNSNWVPTCKDMEPARPNERSHQYKWIVSTNDTEVQKKGYRSHQFVRVLTAEDITEAVANGKVSPIPKDIYMNHPLASQHFHGKNPGGCKLGWGCYAYSFGPDNTIVGLAIVKRSNRSATLARLIVDKDIPKTEKIFIGQSIVRVVCREYPVWHSLTDANKEADFYHEYYKVEGVQKSKPKPRKIPAALVEYFANPWDWHSRESCDEFARQHLDCSVGIAANAKKLAHTNRPGGEGRPLLMLQNKVFHSPSAAGRVLYENGPAVQITYSFDRSKI